jgi:predicted negative regulator of RcsB-dependent stress response
VDLEGLSWRENGGVVVYGEIIHIFGLFNHGVWSQYLAEPR